ncbi:MAG: hypothetical protein AB8H12_12520 [Lewinella sp.]
MPYLIIAFAVVLLIAGVYHFVNPAFYRPFMPEGIPKELANATGGLFEIVIGIGLLIPQWRGYALWAACGLMIVFLPLHVIDLFRKKPAIGPHWVAAMRLVVQLVLIWWLWWEATNWVK